MDSNMARFIPEGMEPKMIILLSDNKLQANTPAAVKVTNNSVKVMDSSVKVMNNSGTSDAAIQGPVSRSTCDSGSQDSTDRYFNTAYERRERVSNKTRIPAAAAQSQVAAPAAEASCDVGSQDSDDRYYNTPSTHQSAAVNTTPRIEQEQGFGDIFRTSHSHHNRISVSPTRAQREFVENLRRYPMPTRADCTSDLYRSLSENLVQRLMERRQARRREAYIHHLPNVNPRPQPEKKQPTAHEIYGKKFQGKKPRNNEVRFNVTCRRQKKVKFNPKTGATSKMSMVQPEFAQMVDMRCCEHLGKRKPQSYVVGSLEYALGHHRLLNHRRRHPGTGGTPPAITRAKPHSQHFQHQQRKYALASESKRQCCYQLSINCKTAFTTSAHHPHLDHIRHMDMTELVNNIRSWISKTPFLTDCLQDNQMRTERAVKLAKRFCNLIDDEYYLLNLRDETDKWLDEILIECSIRPQEKKTIKHQIADDLIRYLVNAKVLSPFEREVADWVEQIPLLTKTGNEKNQIIRKSVKKLKPIVLNQSLNKDKYKEDLADAGEKILKSIQPFHLMDDQKPDIRRHIIEDLISRLSNITPEDVLKKHKLGNEEKQKLFHWLNEKPGFLSGKLSDSAENLLLVQDLINILNTLKENDSQNYHKKIREHLEYWLQHAAMRKNIFLFPNIVDAYTEELLRIVNESPENEQLTLTDIQYFIEQWFPQISEYGTHTEDALTIRKKIDELTETLKGLTNDENFENNTWNEIENWLLNLPVKFSGTKMDKEKHKCELISNLLEKLCIAMQKSSLEREVDEWVDILPLKKRTPSQKHTIIEVVSDRLRPAVMNQPHNKCEYIKKLHDNITDIIKQIPLKKQPLEIIENIKDDLVSRLEDMPKDAAVKRIFGAKDHHIISDWLNNIPGFVNKNASERKDIKDLINDLINILNSLEAKEQGASLSEIHDNIMYWLKHTALRKNLYLDPNLANIHVEVLINKLKPSVPYELFHGKPETKGNVSTKNKMMEDLTNEVGDILFDLDIDVDKKDNFERKIAEILTDVIDDKETTFDGMQRINNLFKGHDVSDKKTKEGELKILKLLKNELTFNKKPPFSTRTLKKELSGDLEDILTENNIDKEKLETLKLKMVDTLTDFIVRDESPDEIYEEIMNNLKTFTNTENEANKITDELINNLISKRNSIHIPKQAVQEDLKEGVTKLLSEIEISKDTSTKLTGDILKTLSHHISGQVTDENTNKKLFTKLRRAAVSEMAATEAAIKLTDFSKQCAKQFYEILKKNNEMRRALNTLLQDQDLQLSQKVKLERLLGEILPSYMLYGQDDHNTLQEKIKERLDIIDVPIEKRESVMELLQDLAKKQVEDFENRPTRNLFQRESKSETEFSTQLVPEYARKSEYWLPSKKILRFNLKDGIISLLDKSNVRVDDQNKLAEKLLDTLVDNAFGKETDQNTKNKIIEQLDKFNIKGIAAQEAMKKIFSYAQEKVDDLQIFPKQKEIKSNVRYDITEMLEKAGMTNHEGLKQCITDIITDNILGNDENIETEYKLRDKLKKNNIPNITAERLIENLLEYSKIKADEVEFPVNKKDIKSLFDSDVSDIVDQTGVELSKCESVKKVITNTLADYVLGQDDDENTKSLLMRNFKNTNVFGSTASMACEKLLEMCKEKSEALHFLPVKKQIKLEMFQEVQDILDQASVKIEEQEELTNIVTDTLADCVLGRQDLISAQECLQSVLSEYNLSNTVAQDTVKKLIDLSKTTAATFRDIPRKKSQVTNELKRKISDVLVFYDGNENKEEMENNIIKTLTNHIVHRESIALTKEKIANLLKSSNVPESISKNVTEKLLDLSYSVPVKNQVKQELQSDVNYILSHNNVPSNSKLSEKILDILASYALNNAEENNVKEELIECLKQFNCPVKKTEAVAETLFEISRSKAINIGSLPERNKLKDEIENDVLSILDSTGIKNIKNKNILIDLVTDTITGNDDDAMNEKKIKNFLMSNNVPDNLSAISTKKILGYASEKAKNFQLQPNWDKILNDVKFIVDKVLCESGTDNETKDKFEKHIKDTVMNNIQGKHDDDSTRSQLQEYFKKAKISLPDAKIATEKLLQFCKDKAEQNQNDRRISFAQDVQTQPTSLENIKEVRLAVDKSLRESGIDKDATEKIDKYIKDTVINNILGKDDEESTRSQLRDYFKRTNIPMSDAEEAIKNILEFCKYKAKQNQTNKKMKFAKNLQPQLAKQENIKDVRSAVDKTLLDAGFDTDIIDTIDRRMTDRVMKNIPGKEDGDLTRSHIKKLLRDAKMPPFHAEEDTKNILEIHKERPKQIQNDARHDVTRDFLTPSTKQEENTVEVKLAVDKALLDAGIDKDIKDKIERRSKDTVMNNSLEKEDKEWTRSEVKKLLGDAKIPLYDAEEATENIPEISKEKIKQIPNDTRNSVSRDLRPPMRQENFREVRSAVDKALLDVGIDEDIKDKIDRRIKDTVMNNILGKDDEEFTRSEIKKMLRAAKIPLSDAEEATENILGFCKDKTDQIQNDARDTVPRELRPPPTRQENIRELRSAVDKALLDAGIDEDIKDKIDRRIRDSVMNNILGKDDEEVTRSEIQRLLRDAKIPLSDAEEATENILEFCREKAEEIQNDPRYSNGGRGLQPSLTRQENIKEMRLAVDKALLDAGIDKDIKDKTERRIKDTVMNNTLGKDDKELSRSEIKKLFKDAKIPLSEAEEVTENILEFCKDKTDQLQNDARHSVTREFPPPSTRQQNIREVRSAVDKALLDAGIDKDTKDKIDRDIKDTVMNNILGKEDEEFTRSEIKKLLRDASIRLSVAEDATENILEFCKDKTDQIQNNARNSVAQDYQDTIRNMREVRSAVDKALLDAGIDEDAKDIIDRRIKDTVMNNILGKEDEEVTRSKINKLLREAKIPLSGAKTATENILEFCKEKNEQIQNDARNSVRGRDIGAPSTRQENVREVRSAVGKALLDASIHKNTKDTIDRRIKDTVMNNILGKEEEALNNTEIKEMSREPQKPLPDIEEATKNTLESRKDNTKQIRNDARNSVTRDSRAPLTRRENIREVRSAVDKALLDTGIDEDIKDKIDSRIRDSVMNNILGKEDAEVTRSEIKRLLRDAKIPLSDAEEATENIMEFCKDKTEQIQNDARNSVTRDAQPPPTRQENIREMRSAVDKALLDAGIDEDIKEKIDRRIRDSVMNNILGKEDAEVTRSEINRLLRYAKIPLSDADEATENIMEFCKNKTEQIQNDARKSLTRDSQPPPKRHENITEVRSAVDKALLDAGIDEDIKDKIDRRIRDSVMNNIFGKEDAEVTRSEIKRLLRDAKIPLSDAEEATENILEFCKDKTDQIQNDARNSVTRDSRPPPTRHENIREVRSAVDKALLDAGIDEDIKDKIKRRIKDSMMNNILGKEDAEVTRSEIKRLLRDAKIPLSDAEEATENIMEFCKGKTDEIQNDARNSLKQDSQPPPTRHENIREVRSAVDKALRDAGIDEDIKDKIDRRIRDSVMNNILGKEDAEVTRSEIKRLLRDAKIPLSDAEEATENILEFCKDKTDQIQNDARNSLTRNSQPPPTRRENIREVRSAVDKALLDAGIDEDIKDKIDRRFKDKVKSNLFGKEKKDLNRFEIEKLLRDATIPLSDVEEATENIQEIYKDKTHQTQNDARNSVKRESRPPPTRHENIREVRSAVDKALLDAGIDEDIKDKIDRRIRDAVMNNILGKEDAEVTRSEIKRLLRDAKIPLSDAEEATENILEFCKDKTDQIQNDARNSLTRDSQPPPTRRENIREVRSAVDKALLDAGIDEDIKDKIDRRFKDKVKSNLFGKEKKDLDRFEIEKLLRDATIPLSDVEEATENIQEIYKDKTHQTQNDARNSVTRDSRPPPTRQENIREVRSAVDKALLDAGIDEDIKDKIERRIRDAVVNNILGKEDAEVTRSEIKRLLRDAKIPLSDAQEATENIMEFCQDKTDQIQNDDRNSVTRDSRPPPTRQENIREVRSAVDKALLDSGIDEDIKDKIDRRIRDSVMNNILGKEDAEVTRSEIKRLLRDAKIPLSDAEEATENIMEFCKGKTDQIQNDARNSLTQDSQPPTTRHENIREVRSAVDKALRDAGIDEDIRDKINRRIRDTVMNNILGKEDAEVTRSEIKRLLRDAKIPLYDAEEATENILEFCKDKTDQIQNDARNSVTRDSRPPPTRQENIREVRSAVDKALLDAGIDEDIKDKIDRRIRDSVMNNILGKVDEEVTRSEIKRLLRDAKIPLSDAEEATENILEFCKDKTDQIQNDARNSVTRDSRPPPTRQENSREVRSAVNKALLDAGIDEDIKDKIDRRIRDSVMNNILGKEDAEVTRSEIKRLLRDAKIPLSDAEEATENILEFCKDKTDQIQNDASKSVTQESEPPPTRHENFREVRSAVDKALRDAGIDEDIKDKIDRRIRDSVMNNILGKVDEEVTRSEIKRLLRDAKIPLSDAEEATENILEFCKDKTDQIQNDARNSVTRDSRPPPMRQENSREVRSAVDKALLDAGIDEDIKDKIDRRIRDSVMNNILGKEDAEVTRSEIKRLLRDAKIPLSDAEEATENILEFCKDKTDQIQNDARNSVTRDSRPPPTRQENSREVRSAVDKALLDAGIDEDIKDKIDRRIRDSVMNNILGKEDAEVTRSEIKRLLRDAKIPLSDAEEATENILEFCKDKSDQIQNDARNSVTRDSRPPPTRQENIREVRSAVDKALRDAGIDEDIKDKIDRRIRDSVMNNILGKVDEEVTRSEIKRLLRDAKIPLSDAEEATENILEFCKDKTDQIQNDARNSVTRDSRPPPTRQENSREVRSAVDKALLDAGIDEDIKDKIDRRIRDSVMNNILGKEDAEVTRSEIKRLLRDAKIPLSDAEEATENILEFCKDKSDQIQNDARNSVTRESQLPPTRYENIREVRSAVDKALLDAGIDEEIKDKIDRRIRDSVMNNILGKEDAEVTRSEIKRLLRDAKIPLSNAEEATENILEFCKDKTDQIQNDAHNSVTRDSRPPLTRQENIREVRSAVDKALLDAGIDEDIKDKIDRRIRDAVMNNILGQEDEEVTRSEIKRLLRDAKIPLSDAEEATENIMEFCKDKTDQIQNDARNSVTRESQPPPTRHENIREVRSAVDKALRDAGIDEDIRDKINRRIRDTVMNNILGKEDEEVTRSEIKRLLRDAKIPLSEADEATKNILEFCKNKTDQIQNDVRSSFSRNFRPPAMRQKNILEVRSDEDKALRESGIDEDMKHKIDKRINKSKMNRIIGKDDKEPSRSEMQKLLRDTKIPLSDADEVAGNLLEFCKDKTKQSQNFRKISFSQDLRSKPMQQENIKEVRSAVDKVLLESGIDETNKNKLDKRIKETVINRILGNDNEESIRAQLQEYFKETKMSVSDAEEAIEKLMDLCKDKAGQIQNDARNSFARNLPLPLSTQENIKAVGSAVDKALLDAFIDKKAKIKIDKRIKESVMNNILGKDDEESTRCEIMKLLRDAKIPLSDAEDLTENLLEICQERKKHYSNDIRNSSAHGFRPPLMRQENIKEVSSVVDKILLDTGISKNIKDKTDKRIKETLMNNILGKEDEESTRSEIKKILRDAKVPVSEAEMATENLMKFCKDKTELYLKDPLSRRTKDSNETRQRSFLEQHEADFLSDQFKPTAKNYRNNFTQKSRFEDWLPPKKVIMSHLKENIDEVLSQYDVDVDFQNKLDDLLFDILVNFAFGNENYQNTSDQLIGQLIELGLMENQASDLAKDLISYTQDKVDDLQVFPIPQEVKFCLGQGITDLFDQVGVNISNQNDLKKAIAEIIADSIAGKDDTIVTKNKLWSYIKNMNLRKKSAERLIENLLDFSKITADDFEFPVNKKDIKALFRNDVSSILDQTGVEILDQDNCEEEIVNALANNVLRHDDDKVTKSSLLKTLKKTNIFGSKANIACEKLLEICRDKSEACHFLPVKKQIKIEMIEDIEDILDQTGVDNREQLKNLILDALADYILGRQDLISTEFFLQNVLSENNVANYIAQDTITELIGFSKNKANMFHNMPHNKNRMKHELNYEISNILKDYGEVQNKNKIKSNIASTLADHIVEHKNVKSTKEKLFDSLKTSNISESSLSSVTERLLDLSYLVPVKAQVKDEFKSDVNYILSNTDLKTNSNLQKRILEILTPLVLNNERENAVEEKLLKCLSQYNCSDVKAKKVAQTFFDISRVKATEINYLSAKNKLKEEIREDIFEMLKSLGIKKIKHKDILLDSVADNIMGKENDLVTNTKIKDYLKSNKIPHTLTRPVIKNIMQYTNEKAKTFKMDPTRQQIINHREVKHAVREALYESGIDKHSKDQLDKCIKDIVINNIIGKDNENTTISKLQEELKKAKVPPFNAELATTKLMELCKEKFEQNQNESQKNKAKAAKNVGGSVLEEPKPSSFDPFNPIFKNTKDINRTVIQEWVESLPIAVGILPEERKKIKKGQQSLVDKFVEKIEELNLDPEIFNDPKKYEEVLEQTLNSLIRDFPQSTGLIENFPVFQKNLVDNLLKTREKIKIVLLGDEYQQLLHDTISNCFPLEHLERRDSFEVLKDNLADAFLDLHVGSTDGEQKELFKQLLKNKISSFCKNHLTDFPEESPDAEQIGEDLYLNLLKVPLPQKESLRAEIEMAKLRKIIKDVLNTIPHKSFSSSELIEEINMIRFLAKRIYDLVLLNRVNVEDEEYHEMVQDEIDRVLSMLPVHRESVPRVELSKSLAKSIAQKPPITPQQFTSMLTNHSNDDYDENNDHRDQNNKSQSIGWQNSTRFANVTPPPIGRQNSTRFADTTPNEFTKDGPIATSTPKSSLQRVLTPSVSVVETNKLSITHVPEGTITIKENYYAEKTNCPYCSQILNLPSKDKSVSSTPTNVGIQTDSELLAQPLSPHVIVREYIWQSTNDTENSDYTCSEPRKNIKSPFICMDKRPHHCRIPPNLCPHCTSHDRLHRNVIQKTNKKNYTLPKNDSKFGRSSNKDLPSENQPKSVNDQSTSRGDNTLKNDTDTHVDQMTSFSGQISPRTLHTRKSSSLLEREIPIIEPCTSLTCPDHAKDYRRIIYDSTKQSYSRTSPSRKRTPKESYFDSYKDFQHNFHDISGSACSQSSKCSYLRERELQEEMMKHRGCRRRYVKRRLPHISPVPANNGHYYCFSGRCPFPCNMFFH